LHAFPPLRRAAAKTVEVTSLSPHPSAVNYLAHARNVFAIELDAIKAVRSQLDGAFGGAVELLVETLRLRGKIIVVGIGKSGNVGHKIAATLTSTGSTSVVLNPVDALHGDLGIINEGDVILALSYSGESEELLNLLPAFKRLSVKLIAMTGAPKSSLARHSDLVLNVRVPKEACPFNLAPTSSTTAMLVMGDALAMTILQARGFKQQDFAKLHPSGAIGRAMLTRIGDIMRSGPRNAVADQNLSVREGLLVMTQAKSGSLSVVNARGKLVGVFTDGDFRRQIANDETLLERLAQPLVKVMTRNPICVREDALAAEAVKIFKERNIDDLIVVNYRHEPVGLIDSQDLPKLKLM
jgi:arabinose-5-phosphate isomerase